MYLFNEYGIKFVLVLILQIYSAIAILMICLYGFFSIIRIIHPVIALAMAVLVGVLVLMVDLPIKDSVIFIVIIVTVALPMLIVCLCINFHGF